MNAVVALNPTRDIKFLDNRLPYVGDLADAYGIDNVRWRVLINAVFPNVKSVESIVMALTYCKARNLDIFKRPVHIVPMWSSAAGGMIDTVWPGIAELRTTAFRTGQFAGMSAAEFGPTEKRAIGEKTVEFPQWCQIRVSRMLSGSLCEFVSPKVYWLESYAVAKRGGLTPNDMWSRRPFGQLEKCAEAAALRRAFPEEIGSDYAAEEMEGQALDRADTRAEPRRAPAPPPAVAAIEHKPGVEVAKVEEPKAEAVAAPAQRRAPTPPPAAQSAEAKRHGIDLAEFRRVLREAPTIDAADAVYDLWITKASPALTPDEQDEADATMREINSKFWAAEQ
jgi:phage recombination protein Bet